MEGEKGVGPPTGKILATGLLVGLQGGPKKVSQRNLHITSSNAGRFSKFFYYNILREICNKTVIKYPTSP